MFLRNFPGDILPDYNRDSEKLDILLKSKY